MYKQIKTLKLQKETWLLAYLVDSLTDTYLCNMYKVGTYFTYITMMYLVIIQALR